jgi:uncharacterized repeat protein (TIGR01451 family)
MNSSKSNPYKKSRAQAMVEFALVLPLLLVILYGVLESGRLLFIYASTVTAARQAVRYGSATGTSPNGVPYFRDCAGIEAAAQNVGFINDFQNITINYDNGPSTTILGTCPSFTTPGNGNRIRVSVETEWEPIVPIVPLDPIVIQSQSARTILASVSIQVTAPAQGFIGSGSGQLNISVVPSTGLYQTAGQIITYTYTLVNNGGESLSGPFVITDNIVTGITCTNPPGTLVSLGSFQCTGTYTITQDDLNNGSVTNTATATANGTPSVNTATSTISSLAQPKLTLSIQPAPEASSKVGALITYTYTVTNSGNVTLNSPYTVTDNLVSNITCPGAPNTIAPGQAAVCQGTRQLTASDIANESVTNQATATAVYDGANITSNLATATVVTTTLYVTITPQIPAVIAAGQQIVYTYSILNTTDDVANGLNVTSSKTTPITCSNASIQPNATVTCTGTYTVSLAEMNTGGYIQNIVTATADNGTPLTSNTATHNLPITQAPAMTAVISATPNQPASPATQLFAGDNVDYTYTLTNSGNVTLTSPFTVTDDKITITCADQSNLDPGLTRICTGSYQLTSDDIDAGSVINTGTASAKFGALAVDSTQATYTVTTFSGARFKVTLAADPASITQSGTTVFFTYTVTNTGGVPLSEPFNITSSIGSFGTFACGGLPTINPGGSTSCQNFVTTSSTITNTITAATAMDGITIVNATTPLPSVTVPSNICSAGKLTITGPSSGNVGNDTVYTWTISNTTGGPLTLTEVKIVWRTQGNPALTRIELATTIIYNGVPTNKSGTQTSTGTWTVFNGSNTLKFTLDKKDVYVRGMKLTFGEPGCGPFYYNPDNINLD